MCWGDEGGVISWGVDLCTPRTHDPHMCAFEGHNHPVQKHLSI